MDGRLLARRKWARTRIEAAVGSPDTGDGVVDGGVDDGIAVVRLFSCVICIRSIVFDKRPFSRWCGRQGGGDICVD